MNDEKESRLNWFRRVLGLGKPKVNLLAADPKTVDTEAMVIGGEAVTLFRRATAAGVALGGNLVERRDAISDLALAKNYDLARSQLDAYRREVDASIALKRGAALYVDPPGMTPEETRHAALLRLSIVQDIDALLLNRAGDEIDQLAEVTSRAQSRADLGLDRSAELLRDEIEAGLPEGVLAKEKVEIEKLQAAALAAMLPPLTAGKIEAARALLKPVNDAIAAVERRLESTVGDPTVLYEQQKLRLDDIAKYPDQYRSAAIRRLSGAVDAANVDVQLKLAGYQRAAEGKARDTAAEALRKSIGELRGKVDAAVKPLRDHDAEVRKFFASLKRLKSQVGMADALPEQDRGRATAWQAERQAYGVSRARIVTLQNDCKFREANAELAKCETLMKALFDKRRLSIDTAISGAGTNAPKAKRVVADLDAKGLLKMLSPKQQLELLKALPRGKTNKAERIKIFANSSLDEDFAKAEAVVLKDVVKKLRGDDGKKATTESREAKRQWQEAEDNWATWAKGDPSAVPPKPADPAKIKAVFERMALMQFKELCKLAGFEKPADYPPGFPDPPVTIELQDLPPNDYGDTSPDFPALIRLNRKHRQFGDFREMMDTILHENAHAWQSMIVAQFRGEAPFRKGDMAKLNGPTALPAMKMQAQLFAENDESYFNSGDSREAYRHEPLEEQAWGFGGQSSESLLVPPPQRSFDSSKGLKNKFWVVESLTRSASASVRLRERHGIYIDEWKGEKAADKKLTLEGVPGLSGSKLLKVQRVSSEYILTLDLDASTLRGRMVDMAEVRAEMQLIAKARHPGKKLDELIDSERKTLFEEVVRNGGWVATGGDDDRKAVVRATDEVDVEHARLVLDESVAGLS